MPVPLPSGLGGSGSREHLVGPSLVHSKRDQIGFGEVAVIVGIPWSVEEWFAFFRVPPKRGFAAWPHFYAVLLPLLHLTL